MSSDIDDSDTMSRGTATAKGDSHTSDDDARYTCGECGNAIGHTDTTLESTVIVGTCDCGATTRFNPIGATSIEQAQRWGEVPSQPTVQAPPEPAPEPEPATAAMMADGGGHGTLNGELTVERSTASVLERLQHAVSRLIPTGWDA